VVRDIDAVSRRARQAQRNRCRRPGSIVPPSERCQHDGVCRRRARIDSVFATLTLLAPALDRLSVSSPPARSIVPAPQRRLQDDPCRPSRAAQNGLDVGDVTLLAPPLNRLSVSRPPARSIVPRSSRRQEHDRVGRCGAEDALRVRHIDAVGARRSTGSACRGRPPGRIGAGRQTPSGATTVSAADARGSTPCSPTLSCWRPRRQAQTCRAPPPDRSSRRSEPRSGPPVSAKRSAEQGFDVGDVDAVRAADEQAQRNRRHPPSPIVAGGQRRQQHDRVGGTAPRIDSVFATLMLLAPAPRQAQRVEGRPPGRPCAGQRCQQHHRVGRPSHPGSLDVREIDALFATGARKVSVSLAARRVDRAGVRAVASTNGVIGGHRPGSTRCWRHGRCSPPALGQGSTVSRPHSRSIVPRPAASRADRIVRRSGDDHFDVKTG